MKRKGEESNRNIEEKKAGKRREGSG